MANGRRPLFWKLFLANVGFLLLAAGGATWLAAAALTRIQVDTFQGQLRALGDLLKSAAHAQPDVPLARLVERFNAARDLPADPHVLIELLPSAATLRRPALPETTVQWDESVESWRHELIFPITARDDTIHHVRVTAWRDPIFNQLARRSFTLWIPALVGLALLIGSAALLARLWAQPVERILAIARQLSYGNLDARLDIVGDDELASLARALNRMREAMLKQLTDTNRQRRTLEYLLSQLREGVVVARADGRIVLINATAAELLGASVSFVGPADHVGALTVETCIPQHDLQQMLLTESDAAAPDRPESPTSLPAGETAPAAEKRLTVKTPEGQRIVRARAWNIFLPDPSESRAAPLAGDPKDPDQTPGRVLVLTDITDLDRNVQMKTDFVANASHELRTPLAAIRSAVDTLVEGELDPAAQKKVLAIVDRQSRRLEAIVRDLLALSRLESAAGRFDPEPIDLPKLADDLAARFAEPLAAKRHDWRVHLPENRTHAQANLHLLELVLDNLIENAIRYTEPGGTIELSFDVDELNLVVSVRDDGIGIAPQEQSRVFERFYQIDAARTGSERGTGLGLAIVRHAVSALHGEIELQSAPGKGTLVSVTIPQADESAGQ